MKQNYGEQVSDYLEDRGLVIFYENSGDVAQFHVYDCSANPNYPGDVFATITYNGQVSLKETPRMEEMLTASQIRREVLHPLTALVDETEGDYSNENFERIREVSDNTTRVWRKHDPRLEARLAAKSQTSVGLAS